MYLVRAPEMVRIFISRIPIASQNPVRPPVRILIPKPMFDHLLDQSDRDDSKKWSNIGFGEEITQVE